MEIRTPRPPPRLRYSGSLTEECQDWQGEYVAYCCAVADRYRAAVQRFRQELFAIGPHYDVEVCSEGAISAPMSAIELGGEYHPFTDADVAQDARERALNIMEDA